MAYQEGRGHAALRRGRWSAAQTDYFLTMCARDRGKGLSDEPLITAILAEVRRREIECDWHVRTLAVMPDHLHLLIRLGEGRNLSAVVRRFKGRLSSALRARGLRWERGYFDHRIRADEDRYPVFHYVFLNPYRAGLIGRSQQWRGYYCAPDDWEWFGAVTDRACPHPEWLGEEGTDRGVKPLLQPEEPEDEDGNHCDG